MFKYVLKMYLNAITVYLRFCNCSLKVKVLSSLKTDRERDRCSISFYENFTFDFQTVTLPLVFHYSSYVIISIYFTCARVSLGM